MIKIRRILVEDLGFYKYWLLPNHKYHSLNGPYYKKKNEKEVDFYIDDIKNQILSNHPIEDRNLICDDSNQIIGEVNWYWKSIETNWMEVGIVIFDESYWGKGIGYEALNLWIDHIFNTYKQLVRIGLTTWSGNIGMMKLSEKLGMNIEARYRKARIVNGEYYDSISYGILRDDWHRK